MCRGGGGNLLYLLSLISNTLPQLEQSSCHPSAVLRFLGVEKPEGPSALQPTTESG